jgi:hypothetical protein
MIAIPFAACYLPLGFFAEDLILHGEVSDDDGTSHAYFRIEAVSFGAEHVAVKHNPETLADIIAWHVAAVASADGTVRDDALAASDWWLDEDGTWRPPVDEDAAREFAEAAE